MKDKFTVYNPINDNMSVDKNIKAKRLNLSAAATLTGSHRALEIVKDYENEGLIETKQETKTQEVELNGKTKEIKYYSVTASKVDKEQQSAKTIEINYDSVAKKDDVTAANPFLSIVKTFLILTPLYSFKLLVC